MKNKQFSSLAMILLASICNLALANGFYVGADIGAASLMDKESHTVTPESHQLNDLGVIGGVLGGYDYGINALWHVAVEGFVDVTHLTADIDHSANTYQVEQNYNLGVRLLPEYVFTPSTMGHLIIGYANGQFKINDNGVYGIVNSTFHRSGFQTGLGFSIAASQHLLIRLDSLYTIYASNTTQGTGLTTPTQSYTNRFSQLAGELALIYKI